MKPFDLLSKREKQITELLLQGKSNKQIALALGISERTVEFHLKGVYTKLGVNSRVEAVIKLGESTGSSLSEKPVKPTVAGSAEDADNGDGSNPGLDWTPFFSIGKEPTMKNVLLYTTLIVGVLVAGYIFFGGPPKVVVEAATPTAQATETSANTPAPVTPTETRVTPTPTALEPDLIEVNFFPWDSLIPVNLDPATQSKEIAAEYEAIRQNESAPWAGAIIGDYGDYGGFMVDIKPLPQKRKITLKYPIHVSVELTDASVDDLNLVTPNSGGGGGPIKEFPLLRLQAGEFDLMPGDPGPVDLVFPDIPDLPYLFTASCQQAGIFDLTFTIPYGVTDPSGIRERAKIYTVSLACPQSAVLWDVVHDGNGIAFLEELSRWTFENGLYIQKP